MLVPAAQSLPWAVLLLPVYTFGVAMAFPILTLAMLDLFPASRGAASSVQSFVSLVANALVAGALAPLVAFSLPMLAGTALALTLLGERLTDAVNRYLARLSSCHLVCKPQLCTEPSIAGAALLATEQKLQALFSDG